VAGFQPAQQTPQVLIVDDEPNNRDWLTRLLKIIGFSVREAHNGVEAIKLWQEWKPDLILMDVRMPVMDGLEATRRIRQQPGGGDPIIIALTASAMDDDRRALMQNGANDFVSKPCQEDELLQKMKVHLNLRYAYDDTEPSQNPAVKSRADLKSGPIQELPPELLADLQRAIRNGQTDRLEELIEQVGHRNAVVSQALKDLADKYDYDALADLLETAVD
jgi:CheY-like chemotaxis protein